MAVVTVETDRLVTVAEIARSIKCNRSTVSMWVTRADAIGFPAPVIDTGSTRLWDILAVLEWIKNREVRP